MKRFRALAVAAAVAVYGQIVIGAVVRITGSGLGCPDWPACQGRIIPNFADAQVTIEYIHRLVGTASGLLMVATAVTAVVMYLRLRDDGGMSFGLAAAAVVGVLLIAFQGVLGGITVLTGNTPFTVAIHLGNALLVLAAAALVALWASRSLADPTQPRPQPTPGSARALWAGALAAFVIVLSGAYVVGTSAGAACPSWPLCGAATRSSFTDVHMLHRIVVGLGSLAILWAAFVGLRRWRGAPMAAVVYLTVALLAAEVAVGAFQAVLGLPSVLRAAHVALASAVWTGVVLMAWAGWLETRAVRQLAPRQGRSLAGAES
ncbi:MAG TPA: COX15/CtaA family protein [Candidatus Dormibacteraeota bacterium]|nr:COX15/CtaA family protein [Candidatus Dormibacteraeota bacterium]